MFGYLMPDNPYLYLKDDTLFKSLYCSVCKSIGKTCGQTARLGLTYDIAVFSAILHNLMNVDVKISKKRCITHFIRRRPMANRDDITDLCAYINTELCYYKINDDILDGNGGKIKRLFFNRGHKISTKKYGKISEIIKKNYDDLFSLEQKKVDSLDRVCEPFSNMMVELSRFVLKDKATESTDSLFYFLGKWIYLIDALDDYDDDIKNSSFNVLRLSYKCESLKELLEKNGDDISFVFSDIFTGISQAKDGCVFYFNKDLIDNVLLRGIKATTTKIINKRSKGNEK